MMKIKYFFNIIAFVFVMASGMQLTSCKEGSDQDNIVKMLNDNREEISEPFVADTVVFKGDTVRVRVLVDTGYAPLADAMKNINSTRKSMLEEKMQESGKMDSAEMKRYDASLYSENCIFSVRYSNYAAVEIAGYYHKKEMTSDKVVVSDFYDKKDNSFLSSLVFSKDSYHKALSLYGKDFSSEEINGMYVSAAKAENSLRIKDLMLPKIVDQFTRLTSIEINENSYDYYFVISQEISGMIDDSVMQQIGNNIAPTVSSSFDDSADASKLKSDLEILGKEVIYHYTIKNHDDESFTLTFKFPKLNSFVIDRSSQLLQ